MPEPTPPLPPAVPQKVWSEDAVFLVLVDPVRRAILRRLVGGARLSAAELGPMVGRRRDAVSKHLATMLAGGCVTAEPAAKDRRQVLYALAPAIRPVTTLAGLELDFGCFRWRLHAPFGAAPGQG